MPTRGPVGLGEHEDVAPREQVLEVAALLGVLAVLLGEERLSIPGGATHVPPILPRSLMSRRSRRSRHRPGRRENPRGPEEPECAKETLVTVDAYGDIAMVSAGSLREHVALAIAESWEYW